jgi:hypothetical protein
VLRWLLPLLAVLTLLGSSVTAWAAAGFSGDPTCCCPDKTKCHCPDHHGGKHDNAPKLNRCSGEATFAAADVVPVVMPEVAIATDVIETHLVIEQTVPAYESWSVEPEKPPI